MLRRRALLVLATVLPFTLACASTSLPPPLTPQQSELVSRGPIAARVGVEEYLYPVYSDRLLVSLRDSGMFEEVAPLDAIQDPDLIASVRRRIYGTASIPLLAIVTLGVIPSIVEEEWGESFTLRRADAVGGSVDVELSYSGPSTLGWFALLRAASPRHTLGKPHGKPAFRRAMAAAIAEQGVHIEELLRVERPQRERP